MTCFAQRISTFSFVVLIFATNQIRGAEDFFRDHVAPILERKCLSCHAGDDAKGGFSLETATTANQGGDTGPAFEAGKPNESYLLKLVSGDKPKMPKNGPPLTAEQVGILRRWIESGAKWPDGPRLQDRKFAGEKWWSFDAITRPQVPQFPPESAHSQFVRTPIDAFVLTKLLEKGLTPSPEADRRTLIRRLSYDLTGLPPTPREIDTFLNAVDPRAYELLVDRLLDSPRYGERWARHWLDVVHYGDTHGYDKDQPRPNAWPYRDYVIRALNQDKPYSQFVQEQIAGDVLFPNSQDGIEALGFIAAGPWDLIGHAEVPETKIDGKIARHLDRDDMSGNAIGTFNSLTVQCAQCHNHKFDPIPQEDYYRLQAVFAGVDRADKVYDLDPAISHRRTELLARRRTLTEKKKEVDALIIKQGGEELRVIDQQVAAGQQPENHPLAAQFGYHSQISPKQDTVKWVQVDLGKAVEIAAIEIAGCHDSFNNIGAGFGFPVRFKVEISDDPEFLQNVFVVKDQSTADFPNPGVIPVRIALQSRPARYVRVTATKLALRQNDYILALAELNVFDIEKRNVALASGVQVKSLDSIEAAPRWRQSNLVDGYYAGMGKTAGSSLVELQKRREELLNKSIDAATREQIAENSKGLADTNAALGQLPPAKTVYAGTVHFGSGAFLGTGANGGKPRPIFILDRGDVKTPKAEVQPGALSGVPGIPNYFDLPPGHPEGARRAALAKWITDRHNPLTWRSIVNRVWQYHFGRGIVETPNDFGRMGALPTHPELLEWLAVEFRDGGQSLKQLHRLIVTSSTYRQVSSQSPTHNYAQLDADNRYLWRTNRRKLEAEAIRDSVLLVSGKLNQTQYGPGFQDFVIEKPEHSPHYQYHLYDPENPLSHRRSIYRFIVRSQQQPFMTTLDCADPSLRVDRRNESLSALQALTLLNNGFMVTMSKHFAEHVALARPADVSGQVADAFLTALGRPATPEELEELTGYAKKFGLANYCRLLLNLNEFAFVD
ncbi:MAG: hypothetical protein JWM11_4051 [Planctomycetaceae bacterium]|nr:hypothetical protein [Planctomycetaceae bacterium]